MIDTLNKKRQKATLCLLAHIYFQPQQPTIAWLVWKPNYAEQLTRVTSSNLRTKKERAALVNNSSIKVYELNSTNLLPESQMIFVMFNE